MSPVLMMARPVGRRFHRWVPDGASEGRTVPEEQVEVLLVAAQSDGDDPQEPALDVDQPAMERHQHVGDAGDVVLREHGRVVPMGIPMAAVSTRSSV
jgi:hypothetical protein